MTDITGGKKEILLFLPLKNCYSDISFAVK